MKSIYHHIVSESDPFGTHFPVLGPTQAKLMLGLLGGRAEASVWVLRLRLVQGAVVGCERRKRVRST